MSRQLISSGSAFEKTAGYSRAVVDGDWIFVFRFGQAAALTLGILTGNCNMGLVMVSLADRAVFDMVVFFAMGQLPMYMLPGLLRPLYRRVAASPV